jgi:branched-subunit amino acid transport protein
VIGPTAIIVSAVVLGAGTYLFRVAGPALDARVRLPESIRRLMSTGAVVLLTALAVTSALAQGQGFAGWARVLAVAVAGLLAWRGAPFVVVVVVAAAVAAGLRLVGVT